MNEQRRADAEVLPSAVSERVLARASELDAALRAGARVADLRAAAAEAGISEAAFEAALAEVRTAPTPAKGVLAGGARRVAQGAGIVVLALLAAAGIMRLTVTPRPTATASELIEEPVLLRCVPQGEAAELVRPILNGPANMIRYSTVDAGRLLVVRGTRAQLAEVRSTLARHEANHPACGVPAGPR